MREQDVYKFIDKLNKRYSMKNSPIKLTFEFTYSYSTKEIIVETIADLPDRDSGLPIQTSNLDSRRVSIDREESDLLQEIDWAIYGGAIKAFTHECAESLHVNNVRVFDPHLHEF